MRFVFERRQAFIGKHTGSKKRFILNSPKLRRFGLNEAFTGNRI